jgi:hypothetical protein
MCSFKTKAFKNGIADSYPRTLTLAGCTSTLVSITGLAASQSVVQNLDPNALEAAFSEFCTNPSVNQLSISAGVLAERLVAASAAALVNVTATTCACECGLLEHEYSTDASSGTSRFNFQSLRKAKRRGKDVPAFRSAIVRLCKMTRKQIVKDGLPCFRAALVAHVQSTVHVVLLILR